MAGAVIMTAAKFAPVSARWGELPKNFRNKLGKKASSRRATLQPAHQKGRASVVRFASSTTWNPAALASRFHVSFEAMRLILKPLSARFIASWATAGKSLNDKKLGVQRIRFVDDEALEGLVNPDQCEAELAVWCVRYENISIFPSLYYFH